MFNPMLIKKVFKINIFKFSSMESIIFVSQKQNSCEFREFDEYPIYSVYSHVLGSFKSVFSILISVLMHFFFLIFVYRSNLETKEKYEEYSS